MIGCSTGPPMKDSPEDRSSLAVAMEWTSVVTTISLEMALPGLAGYWGDRQLGTGVLLLVLGVIFGFSLGMWHLIKLSKSAPDDGHLPHESPKDPQEPLQ